MQERIWRMAETDDAQVHRLARELGISLVTARVLAARGFAEPGHARAFLRADGETADPLLLKGMEPAVSRIVGALRAQQSIVIYGDYDVDGQSATALLTGVLRTAGARVDHYVPRRLEEGYGLNQAALESIAREGAGLVITVDCGITAVPEVQGAQESGLDVIITDHHQPPATLPPAVAVINPLQPGCAYPEKALAGVGVAYKLAQALWQRVGRDPADLDIYLDLVALGTIADVVPLLGENRLLARWGLQRLNQDLRPGLAALVRVAGVEGRVLTPGHIGFALGPRMNAGGRMSDPDLGVRLLLADDLDAALPIAQQMDAENRKRQKEEARILAEAKGQVERDYDLDRERVLVVAGAGWHPGVVGIVASRLVETYTRPTVVIGIEGNEAKGSGRSISGFNLHAALQECASLLVRFGGHEMAAGLTLDADRLPDLRHRLVEVAAERLQPADLVGRVRVDAEASLDELDEALADELADLEPHGQGNPTPVLITQGAQLREARAVGRDRSHLKLAARAPGSGRSLDGIGFGMAEQVLPHLNGTKRLVDLAYTLGIDEWQGRRRVQMRLRDLKVGEEAGPAQVHQATATVNRAASGLGQAGPVSALPRLQPARVPVDSAGGGISVYDVREWTASLSGDGMVGKAAYVAHLLGQGRAVTVWVGDGATARHLHQQLVQRFPDAADPTAASAQPGKPDGCRVSISKNEGGAAMAWIRPWSDFPPASAPEADTAVVAGLPVEVGDLHGLARQMAAQAGPQGAIHLVFAPGDVDQARQRIQCLCPERSLLAAVFQALRPLAGPGGEIAQGQAALERVAQTLYGTVPQDWAETAARGALAVFADLGLVTVEGEGAAMRLLMAPKPQKKLDLTSSVRYNDGTRKKREFEAFYRTALQADPMYFIGAVERETGA